MFIRFNFRPKTLKLFNWIHWILVIPFFSHFLIIARTGNGFLENIIHIKYWYALILLSMLLGLISFLINLSSSLWNKRNRREWNYADRIFKQLLIGFLIPFSVIICLAIVMDKFIDQNIIHSNHFAKVFPIIGIFLYIVNFFYLSAYLGQLMTDLTVNYEKQEEEKYVEKLLVYHKGSYVPMRLNDIAMINQMAHINWLITFTGEEYILDLTLKEIYILLNEQCFFKINRNQIVNKEIVKSFSPGTFGKIEITLKSGKTARVSKDRAKEFRKWLSR